MSQRRCDRRPCSRRHSNLQPTSCLRGVNVNTRRLWECQLGSRGRISGRRGQGYQLTEMLAGGPSSSTLAGGPATVVLHFQGRLLGQIPAATYHLVLLTPGLSPSSTTII